MDVPRPITPARRVAVCCFILAAFGWFATPAPACGPGLSPITHQIRVAASLMQTRVVVARLLKRAEGLDLAYLVFERRRVLRGEAGDELLVFPHPEAYGHLAI